MAQAITNFVMNLVYGKKNKDKNKSITEYIAEWLSQETKEYKTKTTFDYEKSEVIQLTKKAYEDILSRLDNLEESEYHNAMAIERLEKINEYESNIDDVETKTADEMFEELGYKKEHSDRNGCNYYHKDKYRAGIKSEYIIHVLANKSTVLFSKYERLDDKQFCANINILEGKAIHKKIEELKMKNCNKYCEWKM